MIINFKNFIELNEIIAKLKGIYIPEGFDWAKSLSNALPNIDLGLPAITKTAKIKEINYKKNPIYIYLSDGSKLFFTLDEFRRLQSKPEVGKNIAVTMQRLASDKSDTPSQITKCVIF
jgi:hypothetical protein